MIKEKLLENNRFEDLYILARFMYRIGEPLLDDGQYDELDTVLKSNSVLDIYTSRTYDDDPIPYELIKEFNLSKYIPDLGSTSKYSNYLNDEKSLSIQPLISYKEIYKFVMEKRQDFIFMLKVDGINNKSLFINDLLELSMTRGRSGDGFDITKNLSRILPTTISSGLDEVKIFSETFVYGEALQLLRNKYGKDKYKTPKSSAISMLRVSHDDKDYNIMESLAFDIEGVPGIKTKEEQLKYIKELGFNTVPYLVIKWKEIPQEYQNFIKWLDNICDKFYKDTALFPSDGLVLEVNNLEYEDSVNNQYSNRNVAIKLSHWSFDRYRGVVEEILIEQQRVKCSCRARITPVGTSDGCTATLVNLHNPRIILENNIKIGSTIIFERNSGAINSLVYGDKLLE